MNIKKEFAFLVKDYGLEYSYQEFKNCFGGFWWVCTHSYYNESGCFTIHDLPQREEIDFFYAKKHSKNREELCQRELNAKVFGHEFGEDVEKRFLSCDKQDFAIKLLSEAIKIKIQKEGQFFGIKVR